MKLEQSSILRSFDRWIGSVFVLGVKVGEDEKKTKKENPKKELLKNRSLLRNKKIY